MSTKKKQEQKTLLPSDDERIICSLRYDTRQDLLILFIPSHDKNQKNLSDQNMWAEAAMKTIGDLFGGATAFKALTGVYKSDADGKLLHDNPIVVESYVARDDIENPDRLRALTEFAKRMGRETNQEAVGLVLNNCIHFIKDYK